MRPDKRELQKKELPHILIVDDDTRIRNLLSRYLQENGWRASTAANAVLARELMDSLMFDALIVDVMMPEVTGFEFVKQLRAENITTPVLMLTAKAETEDRITGLEIGADDYLTKPFAPRELELRLERLTSRLAPIAQEISIADAIRGVFFGSYRFDMTTQSLTNSGDNVYLTERERQILQILAQSLNDTVPRVDFLDKLNLDTRALDVAIKRLRDKIEPTPSEPHFILTARGVGFQLAGYGV